jgi:hypothetical protein
MLFAERKDEQYRQAGGTHTFWHSCD